MVELSSPSSTRRGRKQLKRQRKSQDTRQQTSLDNFLNSWEGNVESDRCYKVPFLPLTAPEEPTPQAFRQDLPLYAHQRRSLHRMLQIEAQDESVACFNFGKEDYYTSGGCLADKVGMGKTATLLSLIVSEPINVTLGANLLVAPSHLLAQWKSEVHKFIRPGEMTVVVGLRKYLSMDASDLSNRTLVLVGVEEVLQSKAHFYSHRKLYPRDVGVKGTAMSVDAEAMETYIDAAKYVSKAYEGLVWVSKLHFPTKTWRRVIFEEVQDLVVDGSEPQNCFIQLTRNCTNVWLITATPFPNREDSIYANNQLLGFKRLRLRPNHPAFDTIKRQLYLRNCAQVEAEAITNQIELDETYVTVTLHPKELFLYKVERVLATCRSLDLDDATSVEKDKLTINLWSDDFTCARQSCVHVGISDRILERGAYQKKKSNATGTQPPATVQSPEDVYRNQKCHLDRQIRMVHHQARDMKLLEKATKNTVAMCNVILSNVYTSVDDCFENIDSSGLHSFFNLAEETRDGFRIPRAHAASISGVSKAEIQASDLVLYNLTEIQEFVRRHLSSRDALASFNTRMTSSLMYKLPRMKALISDQEKQLQDCLKLQRTVEASSQTMDKIPFYGSKIMTLLRFLQRMNNVKCVLFSMWPSGLKTIERALKSIGMTSAVFLPHQSSETKSAHIASFVQGTTQVLLLNARTSASGINLQVASHVVLMDPIGYSSTQAATLEMQAIGRVLRMGQQHSKVSVVRFVAKDTMEAVLFDETHDAKQEALVRDDKFFDGEKRDGDAYIVSRLDEPTRRVVRMEVKPPMQQVEEEEDVEIVGAQTLDELINQRVSRAQDHGHVLDLTMESEEETTPKRTRRRVDTTPVVDTLPTMTAMKEERI